MEHPTDTRPVREGFVRPEIKPNGGPAPEPAAPLDPPSATPPLAPLPSQMRQTQPTPEPPLSEVDQLRKELSAAADKWPVTIQLLYKPILNDQGELVHSISFREPRAAEINRIGNPIRLLWDGEVIIEERKMTYIMGALSGVLPPLIEQMDPRDWNSCALRLRKFFLPDLRGW
jgi:hypothetical protein